MQLDARRQRRLAPIAAGSGRFVSLAPVTVHLGGVYELTVTLSAPGVVPAVDRVRVTVAAA